MDWKILATVFSTVLVAELGDKTQFATMLFAANKDVSKISVFIGASFALILTSALAVFAGSFLSGYVNEKHLSIVAGIGFIVIGTWILIKA